MYEISRTWSGMFAVASLPFASSPAAPSQSKFLPLSLSWKERNVRRRAAEEPETIECLLLSAMVLRYVCVVLRSLQDFLNNAPEGATGVLKVTAGRIGQ
jgi:hypothetical protein